MYVMPNGLLSAIYLETANTSKAEQLRQLILATTGLDGLSGIYRYTDLPISLPSWKYN